MGTPEKSMEAHLCSHKSQVDRETHGMYGGREGASLCLGLSRL